MSRLCAPLAPCDPLAFVSPAPVAAPASHFISFDIYRGKPPVCVVVAVRDCGVFYGMDRDEDTGDSGVELAELDHPNSRASLETISLRGAPSSPRASNPPHALSLLTTPPPDGRMGAWLPSRASTTSLRDAPAVDVDPLVRESTLTFRKGQRLAVVETVGGWYIGWALPMPAGGWAGSQINAEGEEDIPADPRGSDLAVDAAVAFGSAAKGLGQAGKSGYGWTDEPDPERRVGLIPADRVAVCGEWLRRRMSMR